MRTGIYASGWGVTEISVLLNGYSVHLESEILEQKEGKFCLQWDRDLTVWYHHTYIPTVSPAKLDC